MINVLVMQKEFGAGLKVFKTIFIFNDEYIISQSLHLLREKLTISIFFARAAHQWVKNCKELLPSSYNASRFDQPLQATTWLRNFRLTNERFLSKVTIWTQYTQYLEYFECSKWDKGL